MTPTIHNRECYEEALAHFNEPMLSFDEVARLIGYGETAVDCYFIVRKKWGKRVWNTCVGGYVWLDRLKGQGYVRSSEGEDWDDLVRLDNTLALNGCPKEPKFLLDIRHDDMEGMESLREHLEALAASTTPSPQGQ